MNRSIKTAAVGALMCVVGAWGGIAYQQAQQKDAVQRIIQTQVDDGLKALRTIAQREYISEVAKGGGKIDWMRWNQISDLKRLQYQIYSQAEKE